MESHFIIHMAFKNVVDEIHSSRQLSDLSINILIQFFGEMAVSALSILDNKGVTQCFSPSNYSLYQVIGSNENIYTCLKDEFYCNCLSFQNNVIMKGSHFLCKHLLAVFVSSALEDYQSKSYSEKALNRIISFDLVNFDDPR